MFDAGFLCLRFFCYFLKMAQKCNMWPFAWECVMRTFLAQERFGDVRKMWMRSKSEVRYCCCRHDIRRRFFTAQLDRHGMPWWTIVHLFQGRSIHLRVTLSCFLFIIDVGPVGHMSEGSSHPARLQILDVLDPSVFASRFTLPFVCLLYYLFIFGGKSFLAGTRV